jgi:hypothetical protein
MISMVLSFLVLFCIIFITSKHFKSLSEDDQLFYLKTGGSLLKYFVVVMLLSICFYLIF